MVASGTFCGRVRKLLRKAFPPGMKDPQASDEGLSWDIKALIDMKKDCTEARK